MNGPKEKNEWENNKRKRITDNGMGENRDRRILSSIKSAEYRSVAPRGPAESGAIDEEKVRRKDRSSFKIIVKNN